MSLSIVVKAVILLADLFENRQKANAITIEYTYAFDQTEMSQIGTKALNVLFEELDFSKEIIPGPDAINCRCRMRFLYDLP